MIWNPLNHPLIQEGYLISPDGYIRYKDIDESMSYTAEYHSSNGYDYAIFINKDNKPQLFPIDEIVSVVYIPIPDNLKDKQLTIKHINGNNRDISLENMIWVEDIEIWKDITYPGVKPGVYEVSNHGRIRNKITDNLRKNVIDTRYLYMLISLKQEVGSDKHYFVHRLVAWEFVRNRIQSYDVNHIDGIKSHNMDKNLEWVDRKTNLKHARDVDLNDIRGENHPNVMLTEKIVVLICEKLLEFNGDINETVKWINKNFKYNITRWNVERIKYKKNWKIVSDKYFDTDTFCKNVKATRNGLSILNEQDVRRICETMVLNDMDVKKTYASLIDDIPYVTHSQIYKIKKKYNWKNISCEYF